MREITSAIIGFGFMGRTHTYGYRNLNLFYDPAPVRLKRLILCEAFAPAAEAAKAAGYYDEIRTDWREVVEDKSIDVVHICTPNAVHAEMIKAAAAAGKYIYCDKPMTATYEQAADVGRTLDALRYDKTNQLALNLRFFPATMRAKQLADEGFLGKVLTFRGVYLHNSNVDPTRVMNWKSDRKVCGGGVLLDLGSHILDLVTHLLGPVKRLWCHNVNVTPVRPDGKGGQVTMDAEEHSTVILELTSGATGVLEASKLASGTNDEARFEIHGRDGAMRFNSMDPNYLEVYDGRDPEKPLGGTRGYKAIDCVRRFDPPGGKFPGPKFAIGFLDGHAHSLFHFLAAVARDEPTEPSLRTGVILQKWMHLAYESAETGRWVEAGR